MSPSHRASITRALDYQRLIRAAGANGVLTAITGGGSKILDEHWHTTIDTTNVWSTSVGGSGSVAVTNDDSRGVVQVNCPAGGDIARLRGQRKVYNPLGITPANRIYRRAVMEWECKLGTVANITNTTFFMGLASSAVGAIARTANGLAGFVLASDALNTLTDRGGTEAINVVASPPTLTSIFRCKIVARNGAVDFYVNGALKNTHSTAANLPSDSGALFPAFAIESDPAVAALLTLGPVRCWLEDW